MTARTFRLAALCTLVIIAPAAAWAATITEFPIPTAGSQPYGITMGPDGNVWFTEEVGNKIGRITPGSVNTIAEFPIPGFGPQGITAGPDGNLWFTEYFANNIGRITPGSPNTVTEFPIPTVGSFPSCITVGPDGNLWFTEYLGNKIGRITPDSPNTITEFPITTGRLPQGIAGLDDNLWFTEHLGNNIGRITVASPNVVTELPIPTSGGKPTGITAGSDGNLWFAENGGHKIGRITSGSVNIITEFPVPGALFQPEAITAGPDGNLWFTEDINNKIGRITPGSPNTITEFSIPNSGDIEYGITTGPDGNLWFTEYLGNKIGRLVQDTATLTPTPTATPSLTRTHTPTRTPGGPTDTPTPAGAIAEQAYLKASNTDANDQFGIGLAVSGDTVVIGAPQESSNATGVNGDETDNSAPFSGAAYVFVRDGTTWTQQAYLKASNTGVGDAFGVSAAVDGDTLVVGAAGESSGATGVNGDQSDNSALAAGAAYVFVRSGTTWTQQAYLKASNTASLYGFGNSVAISGDTVVIGSLHEASSATGVNGDQNDTSAPDAGAAYVFVRTGTTWTQEAYLKASNTDAGDWFGRGVRMSGDTLVVGAEHESSSATGVNGNQADNSATHAGAAYVFVRNGTTWSQQAYLKASNTEANDQFGGSDVSGDTVVVGARGEASSATGVNGDQHDNSAANAGAAYVFVRNGTTWSQQAYLKASNSEANDQFSQVAVSGDTVVVGSLHEASNATGINGNQSDNSAQDAGAVYVFRRSGSNWTPRAYLKASNTDAGDSFTKCALSGDTLVVGASLEDSSATGVNGDQSDNSAQDAGAAYVFTGLGTTPDLTPTATHAPSSPSPTRTPSASATVTPTLATTQMPTNTPLGPTATPTVTPTSSPTSLACVGDCSGNGKVSAVELLTGVRIALELAELTDCPAFNCGGSGRVTVDCLLKAMNLARKGCP